MMKNFDFEKISDIAYLDFNDDEQKQMIADLEKWIDFVEVLLEFDENDNATDLNYTFTP